MPIVFPIPAYHSGPELPQLVDAAAARLDARVKARRGAAAAQVAGRGAGVLVQAKILAESALFFLNFFVYGVSFS